MAGQADHPNIVAEILAAELGADAEVLGQFVDFVFQLNIAKGLAVLVALGRQVVEIVGGGQLHHLQVELGRRAADDHGQVVGRAGGGA